MTANKVTKIPQRDITYKNADGNSVSINVRTDRDYKITLADGKVVYATVSSVGHGSDPADKYLELSIVFNLGYMNVMEPVTDRKIPVSDIRNIEAVHAKFAKDDRVYNNKSTKKENGRVVPKPSTSGYIFSFNSTKFSTPYKISAYTGEFISVSVNNPDAVKGRDVYYGTIKELDEQDNVIMYRYRTDRGVRTVDEITFNWQDLKGIYRYALEIEPFDPNAFKRPAKADESANKAQ